MANAPGIASFKLKIKQYVLINNIPKLKYYGHMTIFNVQCVCVYIFIQICI